jgi:hypothetical protein
MMFLWKYLMFFSLLTVSCMFINLLGIFPDGSTPMSNYDLEVAFGIRGNSTGEQVLSFLMGNNFINFIFVALVPAIVTASIVTGNTNGIIVSVVGASLYLFYTSSKSFFDGIISSQNNAALTALYLLLGMALTFVIGITFIEWLMGRAPSDD